MFNRRVLGLALIPAIVASVSLVAQNVGQSKDDKKRSDDQKKEIQNVVKLTDDVAAGQTAPNDLGAAWVHEDYLKAQGNKEYSPFTVTIDPTKATIRLGVNYAGLFDDLAIFNRALTDVEMQTLDRLPAGASALHR